MRITRKRSLPPPSTTLPSARAMPRPRPLSVRAREGREGRLVVSTSTLVKRLAPLSLISSSSGPELPRRARATLRSAASLEAVTRALRCRPGKAASLWAVASNVGALPLMSTRDSLGDWPGTRPTTARRSSARAKLSTRPMPAGRPSRLQLCGVAREAFSSRPSWSCRTKLLASIARARIFAASAGAASTGALGEARESTRSPWSVARNARGVLSPLTTMERIGPLGSIPATSPRASRPRSRLTVTAPVPLRVSTTTPRPSAAIRTANATPARTPVERERTVRTWGTSLRGAFAS